MPGHVFNIHCNRLVAVVSIYLITGSIIMKLKYQANGSDVIPHKGFWITLPFLVKVS